MTKCKEKVERLSEAGASLKFLILEDVKSSVHGA
jgi:hypothetical protein